MRFARSLPIPLCFVAMAALADIRDGLILYFPCDETGGDAVRDESATGASAALSGTYEWIDAGGRFGSALDFSGAEDGALAVNRDFGELDVVSISLRCRLNDPDEPRWTYLLDTRSRDVAEDDGAFFLGRNRDGAIRLVDIEIPSDAYVRGEWLHFVALGDARGTRLYLNGELAQEGPPMSFNIGDRLIFGNRHTLTDALFGALDEIAVWNRILDSTERTRIENAPVFRERNVDPTGRLPVAWGRLKRAVGGDQRP